VILEPTIAHLRQYCPPFSGRVAGAADFRQGLQNYNANMELPAAYVIPLDQEGTRSQLQTGGILQVIRKNIGIVVELSALPDRRGQKPAMTIDEIEAALIRAMLGWMPDPCRVPGMVGFYMSGARFLDLDRARMFYQWEWTLDWQIDQLDDGWLWDADAEPLTGIEADLYKAPPYHMPPRDDRPPFRRIRIPTPLKWEERP
jgi:hypothetical protein